MARGREGVLYTHLSFTMHCRGTRQITWSLAIEALKLSYSSGVDFRQHFTLCQHTWCWRFLLWNVMFVVMFHILLTRSSGPPDFFIIRKLNYHAINCCNMRNRVVLTYFSVAWQIDWIIWNNRLELYLFKENTLVFGVGGWVAIRAGEWVSECYFTAWAAIL